jgi:DNA polymerase III subunit alpha
MNMQLATEFKVIPMGSQGFPMSIDKAITVTPELEEMYKNDPDAKKIIDTAKQIEGCARHISVHACAIVISPTTINEFSPTQTETGGEKPLLNMKCMPLRMWV